MEQISQCLVVVLVIAAVCFVECANMSLSLNVISRIHVWRVSAVPVYYVTYTIAIKAFVLCVMSYFHMSVPQNWWYFHVNTVSLVAVFYCCVLCNTVLLHWWTKWRVFAVRVLLSLLTYCCNLQCSVLWYISIYTTGCWDDWWSVDDVCCMLMTYWAPWCIAVLSSLVSACFCPSCWIQCLPLSTSAASLM